MKERNPIHVRQLQNQIGVNVGLNVRRKPRSREEHAEGQEAGPISLMCGKAPKTQKGEPHP